VVKIERSYFDSHFIQYILLKPKISIVHSLEHTIKAKKGTHMLLSGRRFFKRKLLVKLINSFGLSYYMTEEPRMQVVDG